MGTPHIIKISLWCNVAPTPTGNAAYLCYILHFEYISKTLVYNFLCKFWWWSSYLNERERERIRMDFPMSVSMISNRNFINVKNGISLLMETLFCYSGPISITHYSNPKAIFEETKRKPFIWCCCLSIHLYDVFS